jgi:hypothetical protein
VSGVIDAAPGFGPSGECMGTVYRAPPTSARHVSGSWLAGRGRLGNQLGDADPELLVDHDHLAARDQRSVTNTSTGEPAPGRGR